MTQNTLSSTLQAGGAVVFWKTAQQTSKDDLATGLRELSLDKYEPDERKAPALLQAAIKSVLDDVTAVIRPLKGRAGWHVFLEQKGDKENVLHDHGKAYVNGSDSWSGFSFEGAIADKQEDIHREFLEQAKWVSGSTVTDILINVLRDLGGIALRQNGSVYWLPIDNREKWDQLTKVVEGAAKNAGDTMVHTLEVRFDPSAVRAVAEGVSDEILTEINEIYGKLTSESNLKEVTQKKLHERIKFLSEKAGSYEGALGQSLEAIRKGVDECLKTTAMANLLANTAQQLKREEEAETV